MWKQSRLLRVVRCGFSFANHVSRIMDAKGKEIQSDEELGDIWVRSPSMMTGYLNNEEGTSEAVVDGWLDTGDVAYCKDGKWYIVGRSKVWRDLPEVSTVSTADFELNKDMIKVRGWQVSPAEIEACLLQHPQVLEASVIGIKSLTQESEMPRAYVVLRGEGGDVEPVREEDLKALVTSRLAKYKSLDGGVRVVDACMCSSSSTFPIPDRSMGKYASSQDIKI
jgi:4-coumarate--CoA ligase